MATFIIGSLYTKNLFENEFATKRRVCLLIDVLLYPITSIVCAVVFLSLMLLRFIFLAIKFLIMHCLALCTSTEPRDCKGHFKCFFPDASLNWVAFLLMIPIVGTIVHGYIAQRVFKEEYNIPSSSTIFMIAPIEQIRVVARTWS